MNKQDRELLVISLFGYFPYKCIVRVEKEYHEEVYEEFFGYSVEPYDSVLNLIMLEQLFFSTDENYVIKPYLRPMSSMTEEERWEFGRIFDSFSYLKLELLENGLSFHEIYDITGRCDITWNELNTAIDWLNKKMFDYRGLIPMGLVLEAPEGMYNFNN